jgi:hypothetical protein
MTRTACNALLFALLLPLGCSEDSEGTGGAAGGGGTGGDAPNATVSPIDGASLFTDAEISIVFDRSMNTSSLQLGGSMAADGDGGAWSTTSVANDTLTISANPRWDASALGTLTIDANDLDGGALSTLSLTYPILIRVSTFQRASVVIGQTDFSGKAANQGDAATANTLALPYSMIFANGILYASDYSNSRILGFNGLPTTNGASADFVLGQSDFLGTSGGADADQLNGPEQLASDGTRLVVAEWRNRRVTIHDNLPTSGPGVADVVVGQADFGLDVANCTASGADNLEGVAVAGDKLIVSEYSNRRILIWSSIPTTNGTPADLVLGQASFTTCVENDDDQDGSPDAVPSARTLSGPSGIWSDGTRIAVADYGNNRVLIWNNFPEASFTPADVVLGQSDFSNNAPNDDDQDGVEDSAPTARTFSSAYFVRSNGTQLVVAGYINNRVLVWNSFPTESFQPADVVLGQSNFGGATANDDDQDGVEDGAPTDRTIFGPSDLLITGNQLLLADSGNNRILVFEGQ